MLQKNLTLPFNNIEKICRKVDYLLSIWYETHGFFQDFSDFESEHTVEKMKIMRIFWVKIHHLTPNGHCAMASRSCLI